MVHSGVFCVMIDGMTNGMINEMIMGSYPVEIVNSLQTGSHGPVEMTRVFPFIAW